MSDKTITVPAGTDKVILNISHEGSHARMTLRQALLATPANRNAIVRVYEREDFINERMRWDAYLPPAPTLDNAETRMARVLAFSRCRLCDTAVLLDECEVKSLSMQDMLRGGTAFVFEVENDA